MEEHESNETRNYTMRKRAESMRKTGDRILDAAYERFSHDHFADVTISSIAEAAGCSDQTVYRRFGSKEGVFRALADRFQRTIEPARDAVPVGDVGAAVARVVDDYEDAGDAMVLLQAQEDRVEVMAEAVSHGREEHHEFVSRVFEEELAELERKARRRLHGQLVVALDVQTWKRLRRDLEFSRDETAQAMKELIEAILVESQTGREKKNDDQ